MAAGMGQGSRSAMLVLLGTVAMLLLSCQGTKADTFNVGGDQTWALSVNYTEWASNYTFTVGDVLQFNYDKSAHDVQAMLSDTCNTTQVKGVSHTDGSTAIPLTSAGEKVYICTLSNHCQQGMKLAITVIDAASPEPSPGAPSPGSSASPPLAGMIRYGTVAALVISTASFFL